MAASPATQPEAAIVSLLKAGLEEGKPTQAIAEAQKWLRQNQPQDALLLYHAGRGAELSGDWKSAVALYQQYLAKADLQSATADEAVYAVYVLLIERLNDAGSAYAFGRAEGGRLLVCPRARQFDTWFLDQAIARGDAAAVAGRLNACIAAGLPADLLIGRYSQYFRWLLGSVDGYCDHGLPVTQDLYDAVKDLCEAMTHDEEMRLRLDWAVSVKAYNAAKIGDKARKTVVSRKQAGREDARAKAAAAQAVEEGKLDLGDEVTPPITEASALLAKYPRHVLWVLTGWAGGGNGPHYRADPRKYWPHEVEAKMAPILAALPRLTPFERAAFLNAAAYGGYVSNPGVLDLTPVQDYLKANPDLLNSRNGVMVLGKDWNRLTPEEAQKLAPQLAQVAHPQASLVRAIAAGGKDFDKAMAALLGPEVWRLGPGELNGGWADQLWHYCGRPGGNEKRDAEIARSRAVAAAFGAGDAKKEDPAGTRIAAFRMLWADYRSAQPKMPAVRARLKAVLKCTPEVVPELLKDPGPEARTLVREAIAAGMDGARGTLERDERARGIPHWTYSPWIQRLGACFNNLEWMKQNRKDLYAPHPLEQALRAAVAERLALGKIEPWLTMAWINAQFPENNAEQVKLMQALFTSPAWAAMPSDVQFGGREWFRKDAMTPAQIAWVDAADPKLVARDLLSLTEASDAATAAAALQSAIAGARKSPVRINILGLDQLATVADSVLADPAVFERVLEMADSLREPCMSHALGKRLFPLMKAKRDPVTVHRAANYLWSHPYHGPHRDPFPAVRQLAEALLDDYPSAANAMARVGLHYFAGTAGEWAFNPAVDIPALKALQVKSSMKMGLMVIPVAETDPAYPVYKSQSDWQGGNEESAWALCDANWSALLRLHRELSMDYLMWVLQRTIYGRDEARQEDLIRALQAWADEPNTPLSPTQKVEIEIAYGDIALQRGQLKQAHEIYTRTMQNKAYAGLQARYVAALRRVRAERIAKDFDAALQTLAGLELERVAEMWTATRYARAEVYYDREAFDSAAEDVASILARDGGHAEAKIMQGKLQLKRQKLMEATEVELGTVSSRQSLVPGEKLKVTLSDPTLAVSGAGAEIEVVVWAGSGDREQFLLRQFGDQKTKFRGEVATALGAPKPDDRVLQVIGDDEVYYAYSERFRKKMNDMEEKRGGPISVASDGLLMASGRRLLSEAEKRVADMQAQMDALTARGRSGSSVRAAAEADRAAAAVAGTGAGMDPEVHAAGELQQRLLSERVKPGNPIYVRVIDPDRGRTAGIDQLTVSVESSSGDSIGQVPLKETGTHTGWFEGRVPTAGGQPMAFAENTEPGRNPNMAISPNAGYPAWRPVAVGGKAPAFTIDLNDNVALGELTITAREAGARLKQFLLQTGMKDGSLTTVAAYPVDQLTVKHPWRPTVTVMNDTDRYHASGLPGGRSVYDLAELMQHLERGWASQQFAQGMATNVAGPADAFPAAVLKTIRWKRQGMHDSPSVIHRFQGYFHEPADVTRRFRLELGPFEIPRDRHPSINHPPQFLLAVDGKPITKKGGPLEGAVALKPGVHRFEIWSVGWILNMGFGHRTARLQANLADPEQWVDCPDRFFDPGSFPQGALAIRNGQAAVGANADGTEFKVRFAPDSRARLLNLVCTRQEGPVPAINTIGLADAAGKRVLPVAQDFAVLNKNGTLEILTGDRVAIRYADDRCVTKGKETQERFLDVAFTTAQMQFEFFEKRKNRGGEDVDHYEPLLRFARGKPVLLTIRDTDMDVTAGPDTVQVTLGSRSGGKRTVVATESGEASGIFRVSVTPVAGTPASDSEIKVGEGETLTAVYRDAENTDPGVPTDRFASVAHAAFAAPELRLSHATVAAIGPTQEPAVGLRPGFTPVDLEAAASLSAAGRRAWDAAQGAVRPRWAVANRMVAAATPPTNGFEVILGRRLHMEVAAPHLALRDGSTVSVFAQTETGRARAAAAQPGETPAPAFDVNVPGTVELGAHLVAVDRRIHALLFREPPQIPIYVRGEVVPAPDPGFTRFMCSVPLITGVLPDHGVLTAEGIEARRRAGLPTDSGGLVVRQGDRVHVGFRYQPRAGAEQWLTASARVITHPVLDIMDEGYRHTRTNAYVGETLFVRVVDLGADVSDRSDAVSVLLQARSGASQAVELLEVDTHSGVFQGACSLTYVAAGGTPVADGYDVRRSGFPVVYGDVLEGRYTDTNGVPAESLPVTICKGADGRIEPFSKRFDDPEMAVRTQFALAESSLEVAKNYRALGKTVEADREYIVAKQMLAGAMDQFRDPETRAHAEYLLGNLTLEEADGAKGKDLQETRYRAALSRFMNVVGSYPDTLHASKAQFKIATVYEKLNEPDIAAQEYVKLAYKCPDSEFLAVAMARLGTHFQRKADAYEQKAQPLQARTDDKDAQFEGAALRRMADGEYLKAARIFSRLLDRFPDHELAGKSGLRAGQAYMRAGENRWAVNAFLRLIKNDGYDGTDVRPQAMYWAGMCYENLKEPMAAYAIYKRLTYDFPESPWAAYARAQLSQEGLLKLESDLEIKRLEDGR